jgi:hypothetical protein
MGTVNIQEGATRKLLQAFQPLSCRGGYSNFSAWFLNIVYLKKKKKIMT